MEDCIKRKCIFVQESLVDSLLFQKCDEKTGEYYIKSDITIMKELSGSPDKFTPAQQQAISARATMTAPSVPLDAKVTDADIISNIVPRDMQSLNERAAVANYLKNKIVGDVERQKEEADMQALRDSILNSDNSKTE